MVPNARPHAHKSSLSFCILLCDPTHRKHKIWQNLGVFPTLNALARRVKTWQKSFTRCSRKLKKMRVSLGRMKRVAAPFSNVVVDGGSPWSCAHLVAVACLLLLSLSLSLSLSLHVLLCGGCMGVCRSLYTSLSL